MTKAPKKKGLSKCYVCTHSYKAEEIDEHMNGITHHHVLEQLYNKSRPHHCLVCGCVWKGLTLYRQHVATPEHKQKIAELVKQRRSGANVPHKYTIAPDLINLCKERDRLNSENKAKRKLEKVKARKAKHQGKACNSKGTQSNTTHQNPHPHHQQNKENNNNSSRWSLGGEPRGHSRSPDSPSSSSNREWDGPALHQEVSSSQADGGGSSRTGSVRSEPAEPEPHSSHATGSKEQGGSAQSSGSGNRPSASQFFSEIDFGLDFTSDLLPPVGALIFAHPPAVKAGPSKGKGKVKVSNHTGAHSTETAGGKQNASHKSRKRPLDQSEGPPGSSTEHNHQEDLPRSPGLVKAHVQHISTILRRIRKSLDEEGLASLPLPSTSTTDDDENNRVLKKLKTAHDRDGHDAEERTGVVEDEETTNPDSRQSPKSSSSSSSSGAADPPSSSQSRLGLPELLKRDLNRLGAHHEPNLTAARRVRTVSSSQAGEAEKDAAAGPGLRPTLQKLINSTVAKRKVNWKELYQEYHRKRRLREKGMPRFGIELVSPVVPLPDDLHLEEVQDLPLGEDFQWDSIDFDASGSPAFCEDPVPEEPCPEDHEPSAGQVDGDPGLHRPAGVFVKIEKDDWGHRDMQAAESTCHDKEDQIGPEGVKPRKERQVDELLAVSLREEELSSSLLNLEDNLNQARSALQEAYVKVQQLLVVREQTAIDINALRAKRIEILRVMRGGSSSDNGEKAKTKPSPEQSPPALSSSQADALTDPPPDVPHEVAQSAASTAGQDEATQPSAPVKEEPASPVSCQGLEVSL